MVDDASETSDSVSSQGGKTRKKGVLAKKRGRQLMKADLLGLCRQYERNRLYLKNAEGERVRLEVGKGGKLRFPED